ncbi:hypothetical protein H0W80_00185 [Candidatus Saccharibacteria bacterium]|nr:hypothetical protein [Candidatus Saccharibacteria bacterium]
MYEVRKIYQGESKSRVIRIGLTESEAQKICQDPETSSMTARKPKGCNNDDKQIQRWHNEQKHWFYSYDSYEG